MPDDVVVPRWEWRTFGDDLGAARDHLATLTATQVQDSDELYLVSEVGDTVKVRHDLMDVKLLREVGSHALERWEPVLKAPFPLSRDDVAAVYAALGVAAPHLDRTSYSVDSVLDELVGPEPRIATVRVRKHRRRFVVGGCAAELTDVTADGRTTQTIAVEHEDRALVVAAVESLGLQNRVNTSYPRGLWDLLDANPPRFATIDVGTNSVKFHVAQREADGRWTTVLDRAVVTRLGQGLADSGAISDDAVDRTSLAIAAMVDDARRLHVLEIAAVGTAGLRIATNSASVRSRIASATGIRVDVIAGEEESRLAYVAAVSGLAAEDGDLVVFDTGGGSSQFTFGRGMTVDERFSVDVGAASYTERFGLAGAVPPERVQEALDAIARDLARLDGRTPPHALVGMGGAVTNLTAVRLGLETYDAEAVQGATLERTEVDRQIELYRTMPSPARRDVVGLQPDRAEVILAGACIVRTVVGKLGRSGLTVSDRGLRHGLLRERFDDAAASFR